jgi:hypothetical protein
MIITTVEFKLVNPGIMLQIGRAEMKNNERVSKSAVAQPNKSQAQMRISSGRIV